MSLRLAGLHPDVRARAQWALDVASRFRVPVTVTSTYRSLDEQRKLYDLYVRGQAKWPANPPGQSAHNYGLAWDSTTSPAYQAWWDYVRRLAGFRVPPHDYIHAEVPNWRGLV